MFDYAYIGKKNGKDLSQWNAWTRNTRFGDVVVKPEWEGGVTLVNSTIDSAAKIATIYFKRPLIAPYAQTMDLQGPYSYLVYLSFGEFKNGFNTYTTHVDGDKEDFSDKPLFVDFLVPMDYETFSGAIMAKSLTVVSLVTSILILNM